MAAHAVLAALLSVVVGAIAAATGSRLVQYGILGAAVWIAVGVIGVHSLVEAAVRPARVAIAGDTGIGDALPRSRPTFRRMVERLRARGRVRVRCWRRDAGGRVRSGP